MTGKPLFAVGTLVAQRHAHRAVPLKRCGGPQHLVEALHPAVQAVRSVIRGELVGLAVEGEPAARDPVRVTADDGAEVRRAREIPRQTVEAEDDVGRMTLAIRRLQRLDDRAVGHHADGDAAAVAEGVQLDATAVGQVPERRAGHAKRGLRHHPPI